MNRTPLNKKEKSYLKNAFGTVILGGAILLISFIPDYIQNAKTTGEWNLYEQIKVKKEKKIYQNKINQDYNQLFENAQTFQDSLDIYNKYGLPVKLELKNPSFEQKEKVVKQNKLENSLQ